MHRLFAKKPGLRSAATQAGPALHLNREADFLSHAACLLICQGQSWIERRFGSLSSFHRTAICAQSIIGACCLASSRISRPLLDRRVENLGLQQAKDTSEDVRKTATRESSGMFGAPSVFQIAGSFSAVLRRADLSNEFRRERHLDAEERYPDHKSTQISLPLCEFVTRSHRLRSCSPSRQGTSRIRCFRI